MNTEYLLTSVVAPWMMVSLRFGVLFAVLPAPLGSVAPLQVRAALSVMVTTAVVFPNLGYLLPLHLDPPILGVAALGEIMIGAVIGLTVRAVLAAMEIAGELAGVSMGLGFANSVDPTSGEQDMATSTLMGFLGTLIFFIVHGHHLSIVALGKTVKTAPPGHVWQALNLNGVMHIGSDMVAQGLRIAAPVMATMFIVQLGTAFVSRIAPRVQLFALSFAIAAAAGILTLWAAGSAMAAAYIQMLGHLGALMTQAVGG